ncbi:MBL fold metallo-hydrolase [Bradymonadaceae bacterium TMQ3]|nr:MBL fold metallo-hydrolase [Bradymonadaceae bacterium TMQ3]TXC67655.1 MBL fold metallo-hydrolase [Bradymonadales bacterium TMQ1]
MYQIEQLGEDLFRIALQRHLEFSPEALRAPTNVYLCGPAPWALINAGHPSVHAEDLSHALSECGVRADQIDRIIATSWEIDCVGGAQNFPNAELFVLSPDMFAPGDLEMIIERRRAALRERTSELAAALEGFDAGIVHTWLERFYPRQSRALNFVPLRQGARVRAGRLELQVHPCSGITAGHMALFDEASAILFSGDVALSGLPARMDDAAGYATSIERLAALNPERALPNHGRPFERARWTLVRASRFLTNTLSSAASALFNGPTIVEFIERDRGYELHEPVELLWNFELFKVLFDELVRTRTIQAEGEGVTRRYGVDVDDPRAEVRSAGSNPSSSSPS